MDNFIFFVFGRPFNQFQTGGRPISKEELSDTSQNERIDKIRIVNCTYKYIKSACVFMFILHSRSDSIQQINK